MSLSISNEVDKTLPSSVKTALVKLSNEHQSIFEEEYKKKMKSNVLYIILAIFFPIHYFLFGKIGLGLLFTVTGGGCLVWWIIDIIRMNKMVNEHNEDVAKAILRDMKIMNS